MERELIAHFLELRKCCQHIPHIIQTCGFVPIVMRSVKWRPYLSVKLVFSWQNLLKSNMSLSMVSFICMCRILVQRVSLSSNTAFFSSTPVAPRNSYLLSAEISVGFTCRISRLRLVTSHLPLLDMWTHEAKVWQHRILAHRAVKLLVVEHSIGEGNQDFQLHTRLTRLGVIELISRHAI